MTVTIIGLGLIGGSFARDLRNYSSISRLIGVDNNDKHSHKALELGIVDGIIHDLVDSPGSRQIDGCDESFSEDNMADYRGCQNTTARGEPCLVDTV